MKIFKKFLDLFKKKKIIELSPIEYDKLIDSKLEKIRTYIRSYIGNIRDNDDLFESRFENAFSIYEKNIKCELYSTKLDKGETIFYSPINALNEYSKLRHNNLHVKKIWIVKLYKTIKFKIGLYYQHILLMREIRKIKKLFPDMKLSNQRAMNLINSVKINKKIIELNTIVK